jgi:hypothetical protein
MFELFLSLGWWISTIITSLISGFILWLSVKIVGGSSSFLKAILLSLLMVFVGFGLDNALGYVTLGYPLNLIVRAVFGAIIWTLLVMQFFQVGLGKAILIAIVQAILVIVLAIIGLVAKIITLIHI